tara:strand:+ start:145 stop:912 length:768 start_codon:yes stop_codon:yes gene_type:complete
MIAPIDKIKSLTTEDVQNLFGEDILNSCFEEAFKFVNNLILDNFVYEALASSDLSSSRYLQTTKNHTSGNHLGWNDEDFLKNRRILFVNRRISSDYIEAVKLDSNTSATSAVINGSIHYEDDEYRPKYYVTNLAKIEILPTTTAAQVYFLTYPRFGESLSHNDTHQLTEANFSSIVKENEHTLFYGIPIQARELVYIQMALNLIQHYMADFVHEEEDTELSNLLGAQVVSLDKDRQEHLQFVVSNFGNNQLGDSK